MRFCKRSNSVVRCGCQPHETHNLGMHQFMTPKISPRRTHEDVGGKDCGYHQSRRRREHTSSYFYHLDSEVSKQPLYIWEIDWRLRYLEIDVPPHRTQCHRRWG